MVKFVTNDNEELPEGSKRRRPALRIREGGARQEPAPEQHERGRRPAVKADARASRRPEPPPRPEVTDAPHLAAKPDTRQEQEPKNQGVAGKSDSPSPAPRRSRRGGRRRRKPAASPAPTPPEPPPVPPSESSATDDAKESASTPPQSESPKRRSRGRRRPVKKEENAPSGVITPTAPPPSLSQVIKRQWHPRDNPIPPCEGKLRFVDLDIPVDLLHAISDMGWQYCTPIQAELLPGALAGRDCTGKAQTGTGKTAAFLISAMTRLLNAPEPEKKKTVPRALILAPTRELVQQIEKDAVKLAAYTSIKVLAIYGGASYVTQRERLVHDQPAIIMATPGRLIDLIKRGNLHLTHTECLVIDEADRMLDMGFIPDVRSIVRRLPPRARRHTMMFSATLTPDVLRLASQWLNDPLTVEIEPEHLVVDTVKQRVIVVENNRKLALLYNIIEREQPEQIILFANRRETVRDLDRRLRAMGLSCDMISGELPQNKRERVLRDFKDKRIRILIATDVAGRGLHIEGVSHVINYNLPTDPEDYVHRIGRTGRAGAFGISISFACEDESFYLPDIEEYVGRSLPCEHPDESWLVLPPGIAEKQEALRRTSRSRTPRSGGRSGGGSRGRRPGPRRS